VPRRDPSTQEPMRRTPGGGIAPAEAARPSLGALGLFAAPVSPAYRGGTLKATAAEPPSRTIQARKGGTTW